ncbi:aminotransferase class I/II-fold pyridoxal phosphate-dependent enzyme [Nostoc sp.]|uniref:aminotransferase class I/II-fold pyridoxal phosphate-dependent enzyme n=1 Tax=Nostoc sp. TaxID=1180 RepID=UPI002FF708EB
MILGCLRQFQACAIAAYSTTTEAELQAIMSAYQNRRDMIVNGLQSLGWPIQPPKATVYV